MASLLSYAIGLIDKNFKIMFTLHEPHLLLGYFYAFLGTLLFSLKSIFIKLAFVEGLDTDSVLLLRMAISLPIYLIMVVYLVWQ